MPAYSIEPVPLGPTEYLDGKSIFHWCPNTHLHPRTRMYTVRTKETDAWGKERAFQTSWICLTCGIREYREVEY